MKNRYVNFLKQKTLEIAEEELDLSSLLPTQIAGRTVCSMISAGTEIHACYLDVFGWGYPRKSGYTSVFRVEHKGSQVQGIEIGDLVFCMGPHQTYQVVERENAVKIPDGVLPEHALFIRLAGVSMATLSRTAVTPGEKVLVTGLGTVGLMAMHVYGQLGYEMIGVDPNAERRETARKAGFAEIYETVPAEKHGKTVGLALECSGSETAVLDCCNMVRPHGEVSVVGVPWKLYSDQKSYDLLHTVFYNYVKLYSGWEMDLPGECSRFVHESMNKNYRLALRLIAEGKIGVDSLYTVCPFEDARKAYDDIYEKREKKIATVLSY